MATPLLFLIRHPVPDIPPNICYGQTDVDLLRDPDDDIARLRAELPPLDRVFSSPLRRCQRLATGLHPHPTLDDRLVEMNFGAWEGQSWDDIPRPEIDLWARQVFDFAPPEGESVRQMARRVIEFAAELEQQQGLNTIAVVSHQGPLRILAAHFRGEGESTWQSRHFDFATPLCLPITPNPTLHDPH